MKTPFEEAIEKTLHEPGVDTLRLGSDADAAAASNLAQVPAAPPEEG